jgi:hypothetical protein
VRITLTPQLYEELELLVETGFYGATVNEAITRLISEGVRLAYLQGQEVVRGRHAFLDEVRRRRAGKEGRS